MTLSRVLVIGGGIGGLAVATALAQRGASVELLEQAEAFTEVGAGLQISPNGLAVLKALGLESALAAADPVRAKAVLLARDEDSKPVARLDLTRWDRGRATYFLHRADLLSVLVTAAREASVTLTLGARVAEVSPDAPPALQLEDGSRHNADLIIAADGIHSSTRALLNGADTARFSGQVAWRAVVPNTAQHPAEAHVHMGPGRHLVSYPLRGGSVVNLVAVQERAGWQPEGWQIADDPANVMRAFDGASEQVRALLSQLEAVNLWGLHLHPVAAHWHGGNLALLGDAAHPTLPFLAQGANMALEDAWVLVRCLSDDPETRNALARYQELRRQRSMRIVDAASDNAANYHLRPGPYRAAAYLALKAAA
ncbi:MAG: FAD-dependent monooxygenase, partial [Pseudomonadota bacterium]